MAEQKPFKPGKGKKKDSTKPGEQGNTSTDKRAPKKASSAGRSATAGRGKSGAAPSRKKR